MQDSRFTESDWKLFKTKMSGWQEAYMEKLNQEYIELLSSSDHASNKFWALEKKIRVDKKAVGVRAEMTRAMMLTNLLSLLNEGAISPADLEEFSAPLQEYVLTVYNRYKEQK